MSGLFHELTLRAKSRTGLGGQLAALYIACAIFALFALVFLSVAGYLWLATLYGAPIAAASVGGIHLAITLAILARCAVVRRRTKTAALIAVQESRSHSFLHDPNLLAVGVQLARVVGWRRIAPFVVAGVIAATFGGSRSTQQRRSNGSS